MRCTDLGNAEALVRHMDGDYHYSLTDGEWYRWNGRVWESNSLHHVYSLSKTTLRTMKEVSVETADEKGQRWAERSEHIQRLKAMVELSQYEPTIPIVLTDFDTRPSLFNVTNGTIDLETGRLYPHDKTQLLMKLSDVTYDPTALCPKWELALLEMFDFDTELVEWVQRAVGYSLTAYTHEQVLFFLRGVGQNGKSLFLNILHAILGPYAKHLHSHTLMSHNSNNNAKDSDIARMVGARLVTAVESRKGQAWDEELVKQITGSDSYVSARFLRHDTFQFKPTWKTWFSSNYYPDVKSITDVSIWRRLRVIGFPHQFVPGKDRNPHLEEELRLELVGILSWAVQGCRKWMEHGLGEMPVSMQKEIEEYKKEVDVLGSFLEDMCVIHPKMQIGVGDLYDTYMKWCKLNGMVPVSKIEFGKKIGEIKDVEQDRTSSVRVWRGIGIGNIPAAKLWDFKDE